MPFEIWDCFAPFTNNVPVSSLSVQTETTIYTPKVAAAGMGLRFKLAGVVLSASVAGVYTFRDGVGGPVIANLYLAANQSPFPVRYGNGIPSAKPNNSCTLTGPATATVTGNIFFADDELVNIPNPNLSSVQ